MAFECPRRSSPPSPMFDADTGCIATDPAPSARRRFRSKTGIENLPANEHAQETPHTPSPTRTTRRIQSGCAGSRPRLRDGMPGSPSQHIDITRAKWIPYFQDSRTGKNGWHGMSGQFRQSVFGRLGGYDDVNDADRLGRDPAMRWIVGGKAIERQAASTSQMGRFETELLATDANVEALVDMNGVWIDKVHDRHPEDDHRRTAASARPMANKRERRTMVTSAVQHPVHQQRQPGPMANKRDTALQSGFTSAVPASIRYSCSTSSATWRDVPCAPVMFTVPTDGGMFWSRW